MSGIASPTRTNARGLVLKALVEVREAWLVKRVNERDIIFAVCIGGLE